MGKTPQLILVNRYYDRTRPEYNLFWGSHRNLAMHFGYYEKGIYGHDEAVANLNKRLSQLIGISKDDIVLDAGSGLDGSSLWLAKNLGCHVTGVNIVKWQNDLANHHAAQRNLTNKVKFIIAVVEDTINIKNVKKSLVVMQLIKGGFK